MMNDQEAYEFYSKPENLVPAGPGRRRRADRLGVIISVRFAARAIERIETAARAEGMTMSGWIRRLVGFELARLARLQRPSGLIEGSGRRGQPWCFQTQTMTSNTAPAGHTFRCAHLAIGGVQSASCWICGPLPMVA